MDAEKAKGQYSPLNNLSSSGEEVEQFVLPAPVPQNPHCRPKKRRRRKDLDSLKTDSLMNSFRGGRVCPTCSGMITAAVIIILIACVCGLAVMLYYLSNDVAKMQKLIDNLQVAKGSSVSQMISLQSKSDSIDTRLQQLELMSSNISAQFQSQHEHISSLGHDVKRLRASTADKMKAKSGDKSGEESQKQLAKFGSDILALKGDLASLQQQQLSVDSRLSDLDSNIQSVNKAYRNGELSQPTGATTIASGPICMYL